jgi:hypothetical protein
LKVSSAIDRGIGAFIRLPMLLTAALAPRLAARLREVVRAPA